MAIKHTRTKQNCPVVKSIPCKIDRGNRNIARLLSAPLLKVELLVVFHGKPLFVGKKFSSPNVPWQHAPLIIFQQMEETRSSSRRGENKGTLFSEVYFGRGTLPQKETVKKGTTGGPRQQTSARDLLLRIGSAFWAPRRPPIWENTCEGTFHAGRKCRPHGPSGLAYPRLSMAL